MTAIRNVSAFITAGLIFGLPSVAMSSGDKALETSTGWLSLIQGFIPEGKYRCAVDTIMNKVRPSAYRLGGPVSSSNVGLLEAGRELVKNNPCFGEIGKEFWNGIDRGPYTSSKKLSPQWGRPRLNERTGQGRFAGREPGWLWQKALLASKNQPDVAVELLALCMNDDIGTNYEAGESSLATQRFLIDRKINDLEKLIEMRKPILKLFLKGSAEYAASQNVGDILQAKIKDLKEQLRTGRFKKDDLDKRNLDCPDSTESPQIFANQAVDRSFDIPEDLKERIAKVQSPRQGTAGLLAKSYHFVAGAQMACALTKCGLDSATVTKAGVVLASAYRALYLCPKIKTNLELMNKVAEEIDRSPPSPDFPARAAILLKTMKLPADPLYIVEPQDPQLKAEFAARSTNEKTKRIRDLLVEMDASVLYEKYYLGGPDSLIPCTAIRYGPDDLTIEDPAIAQGKRTDPAAMKPAGSMCAIVGWSIERCAKAREKLATWDMDFLWTAKQHELGAQFGAKVCTDRKAQKFSDKSLCDSGVEPPEKAAAERGVQ